MLEIAPSVLTEIRIRSSQRSFEHERMSVPTFPGTAGVCPVFVQHVPERFRRFYAAVLSNPTCVQHTYYHSLVPWTRMQSKFSPMLQTMSGSESSSLDEQTLGRLQSFGESATLQKVPRSIALMNQELAIGYVCVLSAAFDLICNLG
jgi:hypothetical protein